MNFAVVTRYVGLVLIFNAVFLFLSAGIAFYYDETSLFPLLYSGIIALIFGLFPLIFVPQADEISNNEGLIIVIASWLLSCTVGMLPYILWGDEFTISNAWFETVSGYTTTGATILNDIEKIPKSLLFWRASTHWIGGIGIIIFVLAVLPILTNIGVMLYRSEISPAARRQFKMRARQVVRILTSVYLGITILEFAALMLCGMDWFDSITHSFATVATGGFSTKNMSIASFNNPTIEVVIMIFMIISGINFVLLFALISGEFSHLKKSEVLKYYIIGNIIAIFLVALNNLGTTYDTFTESLRS